MCHSYCLFSLSLLLLTSCDRKEDVIADEKSKIESQEIVNNSQFLKGKTFISRSGSKGGMDSDAEIFFQEGQKVTLVESGLDSVRYEGTFSIDEKTGEIELKLPKYIKVWPKIRLEVRDGRALIFRSDGQTSMPPELKDAKEFQGYWPFAEQVGK